MLVKLSTDIYRYTSVSVEKSKEDINRMLKKFRINEKRWTEAGPEQSFVEFIIRKTDELAFLIKITVPYIEEGKRGRKSYYDEKRSYRILFHYLKSLLTAKEAEISTIEEIFMPHIVTTADGRTLGDQMKVAIEKGNQPALEGFSVVGIKEKNKVLRVIKTEET